MDTTLRSNSEYISHLRTFHNQLLNSATRGLNETPFLTFWQLLHIHQWLTYFNMNPHPPSEVELSPTETPFMAFYGKYMCILQFYVIHRTSFCHNHLILNIPKEPITPKLSAFTHNAVDWNRYELPDCPDRLFLRGNHVFLSTAVTSPHSIWPPSPSVVSFKEPSLPVRRESLETAVSKIVKAFHRLRFKQCTKSGLSSLWRWHIVWAFSEDQSTEDERNEANLRHSCC